MMVVDLLVCIAIAAAALAAVVLGTIRLRRVEQYTMQDSFAAMQRIMAALSELPDLPPKARMAKRRAIVMDILKDVGFILYSAGDWRRDDNPEVRKQARDLVGQIADLQWELLKSRFLFRFRPKLVTDCRRVFDAVDRHGRVWIAYIQLLKARYPEKLGNGE